MKLKTVKSAMKRIASVTGTGKILHRKLSAQHLSAGKSKRVRTNSRKKVAFTKADARNIKKLVPYI